MLTALATSFFATSIGKKLPPWLWEIVLITLLVGAGMFWHHSRIVSHDNAVRAAQLHADQVAVDKMIANWRAAAAKAKAEDAANVARVQTRQAQISSDTERDYESRIAAARATADRLRQQLASETRSSRGRGASVPGLSAAAGGPAQAPSQDGLPPLSIDDRLTATDQAIQLDELIKWVKKQAAVPVNGK